MKFNLHAHRNALILFKLALESGDLDAAQKDIELLKTAVESNPAVWDLLSHPLVPAAINDEIFKNKFTKSVSSMLELIVAKRQARLIPAMAEEFRALMNKYKKVEELTVETAISLEPAQLKAIGDKISRLRGSAVAVKERLNPELLGGLILRCNEWTADFSFRSQLESLRRRLSE